MQRYSASTSRLKTVVKYCFKSNTDNIYDNAKKYRSDHLQSIYKSTD